MQSGMMCLEMGVSLKENNYFYDITVVSREAEVIQTVIFWGHLKMIEKSLARRQLWWS